MDAKSRRPFWQYGLRTLFWLMLCVAIGFGAYRQGFERGANTREVLGRQYKMVYYIDDVWHAPKTHAEFDAFTDVLISNVLPNTWEVYGGSATIYTFEVNSSLVVDHDKDGHEQVAAYLDKLRVKNMKQRLASKAK